MNKRFNVPSQILGDQGKYITEVYRTDTEENRQLLENIGITGDWVDEVEELSQLVMVSDDAQETLKTTTLIKRKEATAATQSLIAWRKDVLARVKLAFGEDPRIEYFRPGRLRSQRIAHVAREARLIVASIKRFSNATAMVARGVDDSLAEQGEERLAAAETADSQTAQALADQKRATRELCTAEARLGKLLSELERCAASVFPTESAGRSRYRMNRIRTYIAQTGPRHAGEEDVPEEPTKVEQTVPSQVEAS